MKAAVQIRRTQGERRSAASADPLRPADVPLVRVERELKRQLPDVRLAVERLEAAKVVSPAALNFKFSI